eukprot:Hpha_TRINITY_DN15958_c1_g1::TRINITY_DN15958_c1_g1_i6::g.73043::m.73043
MHTLTRSLAPAPSRLAMGNCASVAALQQRHLLLLASSDRRRRQRGPPHGPLRRVGVGKEKDGLDHQQQRDEQPHHSLNAETLRQHRAGLLRGERKLVRTLRRARLHPPPSLVQLRLHLTAELLPRPLQLVACLMHPPLRRLHSRHGLGAGTRHDLVGPQSQLLELGPHACAALRGRLLRRRHGRVSRGGDASARLAHEGLALRHAALDRLPHPRGARLHHRHHLLVTLPELADGPRRALLQVGDTLCQDLVSLSNEAAQLLLQLRQVARRSRSREHVKGRLKSGDRLLHTLAAGADRVVQLRLGQLAQRANPGLHSRHFYAVVASKRFSAKTKDINKVQK